MPLRHLWSLALAILAGVWLAAPGWMLAQSQQPGTPQHEEAAKLQNPVKPDAASIAAGKKLYDVQCVECHGEAGKGDGPMAPYTDPMPPNLTDAEWKHGSADGEIFTAIRDGVKDTEMRAFAKDIPERQIWDVVNYIRSLGTTPAKAHD